MTIFVNHIPPLAWLALLAIALAFCAGVAVLEFWLPKYLRDDGRGN